MDGSTNAAGAAPRESLRARAKTVDPRFSLTRHLAKTFAIAGAISALGAWLARDATLWHWLALPLFWLVANVFEWAVHRYLMHRPLRPRVLYTNHAIVHHKAFAGDDQEIHSLQELSVVMMPWYTLIMVFLMASPIAAVAAAIGGPALAGVFLIAAVGYFLLYELLHTVHHLPTPLLQRSGLAKLPVVERLRRHHHHHHQLERMARVNFNVTFPFADRLLGTYESPA